MTFIYNEIMDGVDISSNSEIGDDEIHDGIRRECYGSVGNLSMESDVDAELDYDEENGDNIEMEHVQEQNKGIIERDRMRNNGDDRNGEYNKGSMKQDVADGEFDYDEGRIDEITTDGTGKEDEMDGELSEEGEIDDLEEGELKSDEESVTGSVHSDEKPTCRPIVRNREKGFERSPHRLWRDDPASVGICKFYLRGTCTWGPDCKYLHIKEPRSNGPVAVQSSSSNSSTYPQRSDPEKTRRSRSRELTKPGTNTHTVYPSSSTSNENETALRGDETAWEKGLRQARELMIKASKKREEEPDFDWKRLVLAPSEDMDRPRTTDEESDDSRGHRRMHHRTSRSPLSRNIVRGPNGVILRARADVPCPRPRRYDDPMGPNDITGDRYIEPERRGVHERNELMKPRKIPSLIDTMLEGRRFDLPRRCDYGRDEPTRVPPKDLGPQVLYPNGRPTYRRHPPPPRRDNSPTDRYRVPRRDSLTRDSHSPLSRTPRNSRSPNLRRSLSPPAKRRGSPLLTENRREMGRKRSNVVPVGGLLSAGDQIHDPWERAHKKERSKDRELISLTLGAELQKARKTSDLGKQARHQDTTSSASSVSRRSASITSSVTSRSRSHSRASSRSRHRPALHLSLASAVASRSLIDDDGSLRATDLSSFRIPKKKRSSPPSSVNRMSTIANRGYKQPSDRSSNQNKRNVPSAPPKRPLLLSPSHHSGSTLRGKKGVGVHANKFVHKRNDLDGKEDISSDESSSSTSGDSSSTSDDAEPAAYRLKKKIDDGLPTEGIPLSPEAAAEDVSSDEDENASDISVHEPTPQHSKKTSSIGSSRPSSRKATVPECYESGVDDGDYVDNEAEKEERRAELLRQLKCVEEAIARKRSRPIS